MFSFFSQFINLLAQALEFLENIVGNYGLAIIVFTLFIKFALLPLTLKQTRSMRYMQEIQPKVKKNSRKI